LFKMYGEFNGDLSDSRSVRTLFPLADAEMIVLQLRWSQPLMPELLIHGMEKTVARRQGAVRPFLNPYPAQKVLVHHKLFTMLFNNHCFRRECSRDRSG